MALFSSVGVIFIFAFLLVAAGQGYKISVGNSKIIVFFLILMFVGFAYAFEPKEFIRWDLLEYYKLCDKMAGMNIQEAFTKSEYGQFILINLFFYFVSKTGNYHLIAAVPIAIEGIIFSYILFDSIINLNLQYKKHSSRTIEVKILFFTIFAWFSIVSIKLAVAGVRCTLAVAVCFLAVYLEYVKKNKKYLVYILYVCAMLIHLVALVIIVIRIASLLNRKVSLFVILNIFMLLGKPVISAARNLVNGGYMEIALYKIERYWNTFLIFGNEFHVSKSVFLVYICWIIVECFFIYMTKYVSKFYDGKNDYEQRILNVCEAFGYFSLGLIMNYLYTQRMMYILAFMMILIIPRYLSVAKTKKDFFIQLILSGVMIYIVFMNDIYGFLVNYTGIYFLAR